MTFGLFFFDADLDGFEDLFMVNGHVVDETRLRHVPVPNHRSSSAISALAGLWKLCRQPGAVWISSW